MSQKQNISTPFQTTIPGYPRVASQRAYKSLLEGYWNRKLFRAEFEQGAETLRTERLETQSRLGLDIIPVGDFSLYDQVLDTAIQFGCIPDRYEYDGGEIDHDLYFAMARGRDGVAPLEMTKWFDTNYHYLAPELPAEFRITSNRTLTAFRHARTVVGDKAKPVMIGPFTFLKLARVSAEFLGPRLGELVPLYRQVLKELAAEGASLIQVDEPFLVCDIEPSEIELFRQAYKVLTEAAPILLQTYFGDVAAHYDVLSGLPFAGIGLDFVHGRAQNLSVLSQGFPSDTVLVAGVVNGRNVWRTDLDDVFELVQSLTEIVSPDRLILGSSCSLLHLPETTAPEIGLPLSLKQALSFAQERVIELDLLSQALRNGKASVAEPWREMRRALDDWNSNQDRFDVKVQTRSRNLDKEPTQRRPYAERRERQAARLNLPLLPTTTIGSFPQTAELRRARARRKADPEAYEQAILNEIESVIRIQEQIGLDVLVHGEPERNDMVQFFGDQMKGFATTVEGWVQSYGSRCVRPPIIFGDVDRIHPMTVKELSHALSLTNKPLKGMLTGPVTILKWSFVREDIPIQEVAFQIAWAIRDEVRDLEGIGLPIVQIDEAAFREGLPIKNRDRGAYIEWAVKAFRLATSGARPETQIHTHMCYSEFGDMIEAIAAMDADVISIEDARSEGALLETLQEFHYPLQIGPGVYDIHSPNVPTAEFMANRIRMTLNCLPADQVWVNPDCGLKTRRYEEVVPSLINMVAAARMIRGEIATQLEGSKRLR